MRNKKIKCPICGKVLSFNGYTINSNDMKVVLKCQKCSLVVYLTFDMDKVVKKFFSEICEVKEVEKSE